MSDVPMPRDLSEEAVARWLHDIAAGSNPGMQVALRARAVRALLEAKVREAVRYCVDDDETDAYVASIVSRVLGDHPSNASGGHDEGCPARGEAPRG